MPGSDITISADAIDSDSTITKVEFFEGGNVKLGEATSTPYSLIWTDVPDGMYTLTAKAYDNEGGSRSSLSTHISVLIPIAVTGVQLDEIGALAVGASGQVIASISPSDATNQNLVFSIDNPSIASITEDGFLTGLAEGEVTITVTTDDGEFVDSQLIHIIFPSTEFNWALNQPVVGSATPDGTNDEDNLVDDSTGTRWSVEEFPQSATIDLGGFIKMTQIELTCYEDRAYQYTIESALEEDGPYTTIINRSTNTVKGKSTLPIINVIDSLEARFVKIIVSGADEYTGPWVSLTELRVFGEGERIFTNSEELTINNLMLCPNPGTSTVAIEGETEYEQVSIFDSSGKRVMQQKMNASARIDISALRKGTYIVVLEGGNKPSVSKLVKL